MIRFVMMNCELSLPCLIDLRVIFYPNALEKVFWCVCVLPLDLQNCKILLNLGPISRICCCSGRPEIKAIFSLVVLLQRYDRTKSEIMAYSMYYVGDFCVSVFFELPVVDDISWSIWCLFLIKEDSLALFIASYLELCVAKESCVQ